MTDVRDPRRGSLAVAGAVIALAALLVLVAALLEPVRMALAVAAPGPLAPDTTTVGPVELTFGAATALGSGYGLVILVSAIAVGLVASGRPRDVVFVVLAVGGASLVSRLAKDLYDAPRPATVDQAAHLPTDVPAEVALAFVIGLVVVGLVAGSGARAVVAGGIVLVVLLLAGTGDQLIPITRGFDSFPSGHATSSASLATAVILLAWTTDGGGPSRWRWAVTIAAVAYTLLVGLSRLYLGVHYPADVIAGWCLGVAWTVVLWAIWRATARRDDRATPSGG